MRYLIGNNLRVKIISDGDDRNYRGLGWKHGFPPFPGTSPVLNQYCFISLVKNPYSWLLSFKKNPHHPKWGSSIRINQISFEEFLTKPVESFKNPVDLWNQKTAAYVAFVESLGEKRARLVRYEDALRHPHRVVDEIAEQFHFEQNDNYFTNIENTALSTGRLGDKFTRRRYYLKEIWKKDISPEARVFITQHLDQDLVQKLKYDVL